MDFKELWEKNVDWLLTTGIKIALIIFGFLLFLKIIKIISKKMLRLFKNTTDDIEVKKRADTLSATIRYVLTTVLMVITLVMVLGEFGIEIGPILAAAGVVGLAVGFGAQHVIKDLISGFFILMDDEIRVGDVVQIAGKSGLVEKMTLRVTTLRDLNGTVHYIPNGSIDTVSNLTKEFSRYVFDIGVAYRENVDEVIKVIKELDEEMRADKEYQPHIFGPLEILGLDKFGDSAVIIKAHYTTKPQMQWIVGREFNRRLKNRFDEKGIEIPFPHVTLYMGIDKQGNQPPLNVNIREKSKN